MLDTISCLAQRRETAEWRTPRTSSVAHAGYCKWTIVFKAENFLQYEKSEAVCQLTAEFCWCHLDECSKGTLDKRLPRDSPSLPCSRTEMEKNEKKLWELWTEKKDKSNISPVPYTSYSFCVHSWSAGESVPLIELRSREDTRASEKREMIQLKDENRLEFILAWSEGMIRKQWAIGARQKKRNGEWKVQDDSSHLLSVLLVCIRRWRGGTWKLNRLGYGCCNLTRAGGFLRASSLNETYVITWKESHAQCS